MQIFYITHAHVYICMHHSSLFHLLFSISLQPRFPALQRCVTRLQISGGMNENGRTYAHFANAPLFRYFPFGKVEWALKKRMSEWNGGKEFFNAAKKKK